MESRFSNLFFSCIFVGPLINPMEKIVLHVTCRWLENFFLIFLSLIGIKTRLFRSNNWFLDQTYLFFSFLAQKFANSSKKAYGLLLTTLEARIRAHGEILELVSGNITLKSRRFYTFVIKITNKPYLSLLNHIKANKLYSGCSVVKEMITAKLFFRPLWMNLIKNKTIAFKALRQIKTQALL